LKAKTSLIKKDSFKILLLRMWVAGAVCFFGAWGRSGAENVGSAYSLDLIAGLVVLLILCDTIIVNHIIRSVFKQYDTGGGDGKKAWTFFNAFLHIIKIVLVMVLIVGTYYALNVMFIHLFDLDAQAVPVPLEPILFGILYGIYFTLLGFVFNIIPLRRRYSF
jgi:hypothetical protein